MKQLIIIVALFIGNSFAEDEFPIELTCETSEGIVYFLLSLALIFLINRISYKLKLLIFLIFIMLFLIKVYIFEINPRFSTSTTLTIASGIDEINLLIDIELGAKNKLANLKWKENVKMIRNYTDYFSNKYEFKS